MRNTWVVIGQTGMKKKTMIELDYYILIRGQEISTLLVDL